MRRQVVAAGVVLCTGSAFAQTRLVIASYPDRNTAGLGDVVTWSVVAELLDPDPTKTILATVSGVGFDIGHQGDSGIQVFNNSFQPAFDNQFTGPADDGVVVGSSIVGAEGENRLPPLNNNGGPDRSNPLLVYTYQILITEDTPRTLFGELTINGQFTGAYSGSPFPEILWYQNSDGSPGDTPYGYPPLLHMPFLTIVPAPMSASLLVLAGAGAARRRR